MSFLNASLLLGGLLAVIPVVLHLAMRRQPRPLVFPAVRFVKRRSEENRRRLQLRHWLLLLLRCLAIVLPAAALARPRVASALLGDWAAIGLLAALLAAAALLGLAAWRLRRGRLLVGLLAATAALLLAGLAWQAARTASAAHGAAPSGEGAPVSAVLVVDTSPRMGYRRENQTRLEQAQATAQWLIRQLPEGSEVAVLDAAADRAVFAVDLAAASQAVERLQYAGAPRPLTQVLQAALDLAAGGQPRHETREIYVFTDLTQAAWPSGMGQALRGQLERLKDVLLYILDVGAAQPHNFSVGELRLSCDLLASGSVLQADTEIDCLGAGGERTIELALEEQQPQKPLLRDGQMLLPELRTRHRETCSLNPDGRQRVVFQVPGLTEGTHQGQVRLIGEDGLAIDDVRYFTVHVRPAWPLLAAAPANVTTRFLTEAIAPYAYRETGRARFDCRTIDQAQLATLRLADYAAICLLDPQPLEESLWNKLADYVESGGGLAVFLGHNAQPAEAFNLAAPQQLLAGRLARQWRAAGDELFLAPQRLDHPVTRVFRPLAASTPWDRFPVFKHWVLDPLAEDAREIIPFGNGAPALLERPWGRGKAVTMATPISEPADPPGREPWNLLAAGEDSWPYFVLINELALYLVGSGDEKLNYLAGETATLANPEGEYPTRYQLFTPSEQPQDITARNQQLIVKFTDQPGAYRLKGFLSGRPVVRGFSVNLPLEATDLRRLSRQRLDELLGEGRYQLAGSRDELVFGVRRARVGREFYSVLILALAVTLALEHLLANLFYRRRDLSPVT